jgi:hypothetical protein
MVMLQQGHEALVRGLNNDGTALILERTDEDFVAGTLADLGRGLDTVRKSRAKDRTKDNYLKLYQPVQRTFHLAIFDIACDDNFMFPRLDPARIIEAGLVVRRLVGGNVQGWGDYGGGKAWVKRAPAQQTDDPNPPETPTLSLGNAELDRLYVELTPPKPLFKETTSPLFVAPPEVQEATGRTILFGVIPVTSSDMVAMPAPFGEAGALKKHLATYFHAASQAKPVGRAKQFVSVTTIDAAMADPNNRDNGLFLDYLSMLRQLTFEFSAFDTGNDFPDGKALFAVLNTIKLPYENKSLVGSVQYRSAGDELRKASSILITKASGGSIDMPIEWPPISAQQANEIESIAARIVEKRIANSQPQQGRFTNPRAVYHARAFARVLREDGCGEAVYWSAPSEPFMIAPWWDGKMPAAPIVLPGLGDFKNVKPNVAFNVPKDLFNLIEGSDPKKLMEGKSGSLSLSVDWICSISIPVITLCAFIVLSIFLSLFDLIFQWMLFIKICIPIPKVEQEP